LFLICTLCRTKSYITCYPR